jgi:hypothetical protein
MDFSSLIGLIGQLGIGLAGEQASSADRARATRLLQKMYDEYGALEVPSIPGLTAEQLGPSSYDALSTDPRLANAQYEGLNALDDVIAGDGYADADKAYLNNLGSTLQRRAAQTRDSINNDMAARGMSNSGASVAAKLASGQQANEAAAQAGAVTAGNGLARRLQAIRERASQATNMRSQQFNEAGTKAGGEDARQKWNAASRQGAQTYNAGLPAQQYQMQLQRLAGMSGQNGALANNANQNAQATGQLYAGLGAATSRAFAPSKKRSPYEDDWGY